VADLAYPELPLGLQLSTRDFRCYPCHYFYFTTEVTFGLQLEAQSERYFYQLSCYFTLQPGAGFIKMIFGSGLSTPLYPYALIPLFTLISLTAINSNEIVEAISHYILRWERKVDLPSG